MNPNKLSNNDLRWIHQNLGRVLEGYEAYIGNGIELRAEGPFVLTPEKPNTARTIVTVWQDDEKLAKMFAILFKHGDGTGDANTYKPGQLIVPYYLQFENKPERIFPRKKDCEEEIFLPFFSVIGGKTYDNIVSLEELTVDSVENPKTIVRAKTLGSSVKEYENMICGADIKKQQPYHLRTTGYKNGARFGDPHAIYQRDDLESIQVAGFISLEKENPLIRIFREIPAQPYKKCYV
ncbi:MAG: hypothetical protein PHC66_01980 [Candidatus Nanoarchaeia archaeon]|nr:hypothetical protein [Candidatus Nanoarchaeia archaeon]MDD5239057.1 hypothetical protein [Candidatus Nanoarchaeia archaeon]